MRRNNFLILLFLLALSFIISCNEEEQIQPKPRGYFRITLPKEEYVTYTSDCNFSFDIPKYTEAKRYTRDTTRKCWFNLEFKPFNAIIHFSYFNGVKANLGKYIEDSRALAYKHTMKAQYINEQLFSDPKKKVYAILYEIGGNAASPCQFYATDSVNHFLRGALYFNNPPNADSLAPVNAVVLQNIHHLLETIEWNKDSR